MIRRPPRFPLFPSTPLSRSPFFTWWSPPLTTVDNRAADLARRAAELLLAQLRGDSGQPGSSELLEPLLVRSEEHTSELQSRQYLVCRLLLEKKKNNQPVHSS